jgi:hypothetical protein
MKALLALPLVLVASTSILTAQTVSSDYRDAVLVSFRTVTNGSDCTSNGTVKANTDDTGNTSGKTSSSTSCSDSTLTLYTLHVGDNTFVLQPTLSGKETARNAAIVIGTIGYGALFLRKACSLRNQLPGTHVLIRSQGNNVQVKVGKRVSLYTVVSAQ